MPKPAIERFLASIVKEPGGCWLWEGPRTSDGYGQFKVEGRAVRTHRWAYEHFVGPISEGLEIDHGCRVRACANPEHLEAVTHLVNMQRSGPAQATHCKRGHPYSGANLIVQWNSTERRHQRLCRTCHRTAVKRRAQKAKVQSLLKKRVQS